MFRSIETKIKDNNCDDSFDDRDVIAFVDDDEFNSTTRDRKKLIR